MFSRLLIGVGVPCGGKGAPVYRLQPAGLYVALPVTSTLLCASDAGDEVTHCPHTKNEEAKAQRHSQHANLGLRVRGQELDPLQSQVSGQADLV